MTLAALGVVYGDIGTSPLYAFKETFLHSHFAVTPDNIFGILSMVFWSLVIVISIKYLSFVLRADYKGEGGILALTTLVIKQTDNNGAKVLNPMVKRFLVLMGIIGAAFLYGDGIITPAISILGAVEGLSIITPVFNPYIIPITMVIIFLLFSIQKRGTGSIGKIFGPVTLVWFIAIAAIGLNSILNAPEILQAMNPIYAYNFFVNNSFKGFLALGSVFLVVTGGEALYSDLGHFGIAPIKRAWFFIVFPCLLMNYFGQGAFLLRHPDAIENPFYLMCPDWFLYPLVITATMAATIASQALISGVFSITLQAIQQGYLPRLQVSHTSEQEMGQIYIKNINRFLMVGCLLLVLLFKNSSNLAAAYGIAVTGTMFITTVLFYVVAVYRWNWNAFATTSLCLVFAVIDLAFLGSNALKFLDGGWLPLLIGLLLFTYMTTWKRGREILSQKLKEKIVPLPDFFNRLNVVPHQRVDGVCMYMNRNFGFAPYPMVHSFEHYRCLHKNLIFITVFTEQRPHVPESQRFEINLINNQYHELTLKYGYMDNPDVVDFLNKYKENDSNFDPEKATFIIGRENIFATGQPGMALWREKLFSFQSKMEIPSAYYFNLPRNRVLEVGAQIEI